MILLFMILVALTLLIADIIQDYYYVDDITGEILFYFDNDYDYNWRSHK